MIVKFCLTDDVLCFRLRDSKYLLSSYLAWLPEIVHDDVTKQWPPSLSS